MMMMEEEESGVGSVRAEKLGGVSESGGRELERPSAPNRDRAQNVDRILRRPQAQEEVRAPGNCDQPVRQRVGHERRARTAHPGPPGRERTQADRRPDVCGPVQPQETPDDREPDHPQHTHAGPLRRREHAAARRPQHPQGLPRRRRPAQQGALRRARRRADPAAAAAVARALAHQRGPRGHRGARRRRRARPRERAAAWLGGLPRKPPHIYLALGQHRDAHRRQRAALHRLHDRPLELLPHPAHAALQVHGRGQVVRHRAHPVRAARVRRERRAVAGGAALGAADAAHPAALRRAHLVLHPAPQGRPAQRVHRARRVRRRRPVGPRRGRARHQVAHPLRQPRRRLRARRDHRERRPPPMNHPLLAPRLSRYTAPYDVLLRRYILTLALSSYMCYLYALCPSPLHNPSCLAAVYVCYAHMLYHLRSCSGCIVIPSVCMPRCLAFRFSMSLGIIAFGFACNAVLEHTREPR